MRTITGTRHVIEGMGCLHRHVSNNLKNQKIIRYFPTDVIDQVRQGWFLHLQGKSTDKTGWKYMVEAALALGRLSSADVYVSLTLMQAPSCKALSPPCQVRQPPIDRSLRPAPLSPISQPLPITITGLHLIPAHLAPLLLIRPRSTIRRLQPLPPPCTAHILRDAMPLAIRAHEVPRYFRPPYQFNCMGPTVAKVVLVFQWHALVLRLVKYLPQLHLRRLFFRRLRVLS